MDLRTKLKGGRLLVAIALAIVAVLVFGRLFAGAFVEILWHRSTGYSDVFWTRILWQWGARVVGGVAVGVLIFFNLRLVSRTLGGIQIKRRFGNLEIAEQLPRVYVLWAMAATSALLALWFGAAVPRSVGTQALLMAHGGAWGLTEPILGRDVGFYVFAVPLLGSAITFLLVVTFLLFTLVTAGYAATGSLRWGRGRVVTEELARHHLGGLLAGFLILLAMRLWLGRHLLLLDGTSSVQGIFGFADAQARLPALQTLTVLCLLGAAGVVWGAWQNRGRMVAGALGMVVVASVLIGQFYPSLVQRFQVEPNELARETPYIEHNLEFTRRGFGLDELDRIPFRYTPTAEPDWASAADQFDGLPVWNEDALLTAFNELEARFPYYDFGAATIDRYPRPGGPISVSLSVREVNPQGIQDPNWQNLHLRQRYVAGMGAVVSEASTRTAEGRPPTLVQGIPPILAESAPPALALTRPQIFVGGRPQLYAVINPVGDEYTAPDGSPGVPGVDFPEGIRLASPFHTLALAWRFRDANLLFAAELTRESRFVFRRQVTQRVEAIAPFLRFPEEPYPVVSDGRIVWIMDGFTGTRAFPLSTPRELERLRSVTWVRNSVKVTIDAVTGAVDFYRVPVDDPLMDAYAAAFPGLLQDMEAMPEGLKAHIRYPQALLAVQAGTLNQYHQETAPAFHRQQDVWSGATELAKGTSQVPYRPEYGLYRLPGEEDERFHLTTVFVPRGRQNLTAILAARIGPDGRPELRLYDVAVEDQVPGPRQIEALVEQDPVISQQFSLWRTGGSDVWTGHLHLVPAGGRLLYMEPVFLAAEADAIPELRRFVVSDGVRVAMTEELSTAVAALAGAALPAPSSGEAGRPDETPGAVGAWPSEALDLLGRAEARLRDGDWTGFGAALAELRALLESLSGGG